MSETEITGLRRFLFPLIKQAECICRFALLFFLLSLVIIPLLFPAKDGSHAVVGLILQIQGALVSLLGMLASRVARQLVLKASAPHHALGAFSLLFFLAFLSEAAFTFAFQAIAGATVSSISLVGLFEASPTYEQWYGCLSANDAPELMTFKLDMASIAISAVLLGIYLYLKRVKQPK